MASPNKIICWNVNGIRALAKKGAFDWLIGQGADIICLQETKAHPDQLSADMVNPAGYTGYFDYSKLKKGYSGVVIYTKIKPISSLDAFPLKEDATDQEGRFYQLEFQNFYLINCYFPNGGGAPERLAYKLNFYDAFLEHLDKLKKTGKNIVICGDFNIVHNENDAARFKENQGNIGFLPEERNKLDEFINKGFVDIYRYFYPDSKDAFTWWDMKSYARDRNIGWRIDTFFATTDFKESVKNIEINSDVLGSDHCPVTLYFK